MANNMNQFASGGYHGTRYVKEVEFGITPENPTMRSLRHTSNSLMLTRDSLTSAELRDDAQISDFRLGNRQSSGDLGIELSFAEYDDLLAAALRSEWQDDPNIPGNKFLIAGINVPSFTLERSFNNIKQYETFTGCQVNTLTLTVTPNTMVTGTIGFIGSNIGFSNEPLDPIPDPSYAYPPYDGFQGKLIEGGSVISVVTSMEISIDNAMEANFVIGKDVAEAVTAGRINVTGTISAYFQNNDLLSKFANEIESSLQFTLGDGISASYVITLPRIKYSGGDNPVDGEGPITLNMPFQALYDDCSGTNIRIDRYPATELPDCVLAYDGTVFTESSTVAGTIDNTIIVTLSGGNGLKTFTGTIGQEMPGVVWNGIPAGMLGSAIKQSPTEAALTLTGMASGSLAGATPSVTFAEAAVTLGFCHCPNDTVTGATQAFTVTASAADPDVQAVNDVATKIAALTWPAIDQATYPDEDTTETYIESKIDAVDGVGTGAVIALPTNTSYTAPIAGTDVDTDGSDGVYTFSVALSKGAVNQTVGPYTQTITATPYVAP